MIGARIEGFAARAGDVTQRQQHFGRGEVFAGAPIDPRAIGMSGGEALQQRRLAGAGFSANGDNPPAAGARLRKRIAQASQLMFALQQLDGRLPVVLSASL